MLAADAFGPTPRIPGDPVTLEPLATSHLEPYLAMLAEPESTRLTGSQQVDISRQRAVDWLATRSEQTDRADFAIVSSDYGTFLGEAVLNDFDPGPASANYRIGLAGPHVFGRGYGTAATRLVLDYGFDTVGLHRIRLDVFDFNPRARRMYEKCGFRYEGTRRDAHHDEDGWHDVIDMALLAGDPRTDTGADPL